MDTLSLSALSATLTGSRTRRGLLAALGGLPVLLGLAEVAAGRRKKRKTRRRRKRNRAKRPIFTHSCPGPFDTTVVALRGLAQTLTAERSGSLTAAEVEATALTGDEDFVLEIRTLDASGVPTATILASAEITNVSPTLRGTFDPPAAIVEDQGYALVLTVAEG